MRRLGGQVQMPFSEGVSSSPLSPTRCTARVRVCLLQVSQVRQGGQWLVNNLSGQLIVPPQKCPPAPRPPRPVCLLPPDPNQLDQLSRWPPAAPPFPPAGVTASGAPSSKRAVGPDLGDPNEGGLLGRDGSAEPDVVSGHTHVSVPGQGGWCAGPGRGSAGRWPCHGGESPSWPLLREPGGAERGQRATP